MGGWAGESLLKCLQEVRFSALGFEEEILPQLCENRVSQMEGIPGTKAQRSGMSKS